MFAFFFFSLQDKKKGMCLQQFMNNEPSSEWPFFFSLLPTTLLFSSCQQHTNTPQDNERVPWDFTEESYAKIKVIMQKFPEMNRQSGIMPLLHLAQWQNGGWIPVSAMNKIAQVCEVPPMRVYETVSFYAMYNRRPVGDFHVQFCVTTPCMIVGSDELIQVGLEHVGVERFNQTTVAGEGEKTMTLGEMECMGCCVNAPMIVVSDYSYDHPSPTHGVVGSNPNNGLHPCPVSL